MKKAIITALVLAILIVPAVSRATSVAPASDTVLQQQLLAQIQVLLKLITQLQQQLAAQQNGGIILSVSPTSGAVPLTVSIAVTVPCNLVNGLWIDYGDGVAGGDFLSSVCNTGISDRHTYIESGSYSVTVYNKQTGQLYAMKTITVGSAKSISAKIEQSSLSQSTVRPFYITGSAINVSTAYVYLLPMTYRGGYDYVSVRNAGVNDTPTHYALTPSPSPVVVSNGKWSAYFGFSGGDPTKYTVVVYDAASKTLLTTGTLTLTTTTPSPSAKIDVDSLTTSSSHPTVTGSTYNVTTIGLSVSKGGDKFDGTGHFSVVNGRWSVTLNNETYTPGTYQIDAYDGNNKFLTSGTLTVRN